MSVLLVEDNPDVATSLALYLELCHFDVTVAADGEAGVRAAMADPPDAVVCDIGLPNMDGFAVARAVAAGLVPRPLLIAVTGYGEDAMQQRGAAAGFDHYLVKPAHPRAITALLRPHPWHAPV